MDGHDDRSGRVVPEASLRAAVVAARMVAWEYDIDRDEILITDNVHDLYGLKPGATLRHVSQVLALVHPDDRDRHRTTIERAMRETTPYVSTFRIVRPTDGRIAWIEEHGSPATPGATRRLNGVSIDITERTEAQRALQRRTEELDVAQQAGAVGFFEYEYATDRAVWSRGLAHLFGIRLTDFEGNWDGWARRVVPEDAAHVKQRCAEAIQRRDDQVFYEFRAIMPDGSRRWFAGRGRFTYGPDGRAIRMTGMNIDIQERKRLEEIAEQNKRLLSELIEQCPFGIYIVDASFRILTMNKGSQAGAFANVRPIIGRRFDEAMRILWPEEVAVEVIAHFHHTLETGEPFYSRGFIRERHDIGQVEGYEWELHRLTLPDGQLAVVCYYYDSTELRNAERALRESHDTFAQLIEDSPFGIYVVDEAFWIRYASAAARRTFGEPPRLIGTDLADALRTIWPEPFASEAIARFRRTLATGESYRAMDTTEHRRDRDEEESYDWRIERLTLPDGRPGVVCYFYDLTKLREAQRELAEARQQLELAVDGAQLGTFYCPLPLGRIEWNAKCKEHFFLPPDAEVDVELFFALLHAEDRERVRQAIGQAVEAGQPYDVDYRVVAPDGRVRWIRAKGNAYRESPERPPSRFDGITIDVTDLKQLEEERRQALDAERTARAEAERVSRMKDEFLATLSHELRTPLNAILGWSQILQRGMDDPATVNEGVEVISRNARVQTQLIEDLLDMSRIISGKLRLDVKQVDIDKVVNAAVDAVLPAASAKELRIERVLDSAAGPVAGDASRLQQVVWNLLSNSVKFTPRGGKIQVLVERVNSEVELSVSDTGPGIAPEFLPHIFERFRQADSSAARKHGGLGIGLSLVKQIVEMHGGRVSATSRGTGQGATFTVSLPLSIAKLGHARGPADPLDRHVGHLRERVDLGGVRVLLVDDDADARLIGKRILSDCDADVVLAASGIEALQSLREHRPDVLISDIGMPELDGYEFIRRVRSMSPEEGGETPAAALTAFARSEDRRRALLAGFQSHIAKPVEPAELVTVVASLARQARRSARSS